MTCCPTCKQPLPNTLPFSVDAVNGTIVTSQGVVKLSPKHVQIADLLKRRWPNHVTKTQVMDALYGDAEDPPVDKVVDTMMCHLRRRLETVGMTISLARNHYGYRLEGAHEKV